MRFSLRFHKEVMLVHGLRQWNRVCEEIASLVIHLHPSEATHMEEEQRTLALSPLTSRGQNTKAIQPGIRKSKGRLQDD